jgi:hypothetical protein
MWRVLLLRATQLALRRRAWVGAAPAGGAVGVVAGSWRGGGKLARWRGAASRSGLSQYQHTATAAVLATATSDSKAIRRH